MRILQPFSLFLSVALLSLTAACSEQKPGGDASDSDSTKNGNLSDGSGANGKTGVVTVPTETPSGRTQLPTIQTAAPDMWITLPAGYSVRADTMLDYDLLVVSRTDDPLLRDSTQVPNGMLRIVISDSVLRVTPPNVKVAERRGMIGEYPGRWRVYTGVIPKQAIYYSYELAANDYFARISPEREMKKLGLHLYIAGKDTAVIRQLLTAAQSISIRP